MATTIPTLLVILFVIPAILSFHPAERARIRTPRFTTLLNHGAKLVQNHAYTLSSAAADTHKHVQDQAYGATTQHMAAAQGTLKQTSTVASSATGAAQAVHNAANDQVQPVQGTANPHLGYVQGAASDVVKPGDTVNEAGDTAGSVYGNTQGYVKTAQEDVGANPVQGVYKTVGTHADTITGSAPVLPGPYPKLARKRSPGYPPRPMIPYGPNHGHRRVYRMIPLAMNFMKIR